MCLVRVMVRGRVQGVGYRAWCAREALARGLRGWVRNRHDGSVEALFIGTSEKISAMLEACHAGPVLARVDEVQVQERQEQAVPELWAESEKPSFIVRETA